VSEGGGEVVEKLLHVGVVLLVPLVGVERPYTGESTGGRATTEQGARRRCGPAIPVHGGEFGWAREHQWVTGMLFVLWIGDEERRWGLSTVRSHRRRN
jgi:hypothetical protein